MGTTLRREIAPTIPHMSGCRFLPGPLPPRDTFLFDPREREIAFGDFARDGRACSDRGSAADDDRRYELRVRSDENVVFDDRAVLERPVVVAGDRSGADVHVTPDRRIPDVREVIGFRSFGNVARFHFDEVADVNFGTEPGS